LPRAASSFSKLTRYFFSNSYNPIKFKMRLKHLPEQGFLGRSWQRFKYNVGSIAADSQEILNDFL
jgi:hypothetical protein